MTTTDLSPEAFRAAVDDLGFDLVDVRIAGSATRRIVRLRIDVPGGGRRGHGITSRSRARSSSSLWRRG